MAASLKVSSSDEISDNLLLIASGMFFIIHGGMVRFAVDIERSGCWLRIRLVLLSG